MMKARGFTLVELMITLLVAAILLTIGIPSFTNVIRSNRLTGAANDLVGALQLARSTAIQHRRNAHVESNSGGTDWADGWIVWIDKNSDDTQDADELIRTNDAVDPSGNISLTSAAQSSFTFAGTGLVDNSGTFTLCDSRTGETGRQITLSAAGRVNTTQFTCP